VPAESAHFNSVFSAGLLDPAAAVPTVVKGEAPKRYAVYRNNVTVSLIRAMEANFPAVRRLLGEVYFSGLAREFVQSHPPRHPLLFLYGEDFPSFLSTSGDLAAFPYLPDVARLEQQWRLSYHAADAMVLSATAFSAFSTDEFMELRFVAHPAFATLRSNHAVGSIFAANRTARAMAEFDPASPENVLVTRPFYDVQIRIISSADLAFLEALANGMSLAEAAEQGAATNSNFALAASIQLLLEAGAFQFIAF